MPPTPPQPEPSDAALVARAQRGDEEAFAMLYRRYRDWCVRIAWRFTRDEAAAWDATHDAFAWVVKKLPTLRVDGRLSSLLYPVVKNAATTTARKEGTRLRHEAAAAASRGEGDGDAGAGGSMPGLARAMAGLSDAHRETLVMRAVDGMSMEEIGLALGVPAGTVKSRLHHALKVLRADASLRELFEM